MPLKSVTGSDGRFCGRSAQYDKGAGEKDGREEGLAERREGKHLLGCWARLQLQVIRLSTSPLVVDTATPHLQGHAHWQPPCERPRIQNNPIIGRLRNDN